MTGITIASLFEQAAARLRADFEYVRRSNPHPGEKGQEAEEIVREFLNAHLPKRFRADAGVVIDFENSLSRQSDVLVYDALSSPLYRAAERMNIIPCHNVGAVIEVKSSLSKKELKDAYEKVASVKQLKRLPLTNVDKDPTSSGATTTGALGAVFAFASETSLDALADNIKHLNTQFESRHWPDIVVVLDQGVVTYGIQWPGEDAIPGSLLTAAPPPEQKYGPPPWFVHLLVHNDGTKALNRFFMLMLTHLTFYPLRSGIPPYSMMLGEKHSPAMTIQGYQFDLSCSLRPAPPELYMENHPTVRLHIDIVGPDGKPLAVVQYLPWQNGACVRKYGPLPLEGLLALLAPDPRILALTESPKEGKQLSTVFALTEPEFRTWPDIIQSKSNMKARLVESATSHVPSRRLTRVCCWRARTF